MSNKRILVADADSGAFGQFSQALGKEWEIIPAFQGNAALTLLQEQPCQVVVANIDLPEIDGAELLNRIRRKYPKTVRFLAASDTDKQRVIKTARGAHQFLSKPYDTATIKDAIERALALDVWVASDRVREAIARIRTLPTMPSLYLEVLAALKSDDVTTEQVGGIIVKDMAMMTKMLQLLNSACFGLTREITDPAEAVGILGFETVKTMVMAIKLLNQYDKLKASDFSIDRLWSHSTAVARTARQLTLLETNDRALGDAAFTAGLLHDIGKVVMAANFEDSYSGALLLGYKQNLSAWEVEREVFGANHGEVGAYLLGLWGMPLNLLEATALHHEPARSTNKAFSPLTAVHVANALEREISPDDLGMVPARLDDAYLEGLGLLGRVPAWREAVFNRDGVRIEPRVKPVEVAKPEPVAATSEILEQPEILATTTSDTEQIEFETTPHIPARKRAPEPESSFNRNKWTLVGAAVCIVLLLAWFTVELTTGGSSDQTLRAADLPAKAAKVAAAKQAPAPATAPAKSSTVADLALALLPTTEVRAREASNALVTAPSADALFPAPKPTVAVPRPAEFPDFKLQGIFFSSSDPSAIVNGKTVHPNERIAGARVVSITASSITLEIQGQQKTLTIK